MRNLASLFTVAVLACSLAACSSSGDDTYNHSFTIRQPALYDLDDHAALLDLLGRLESTAHWVVWLEAPGEDAVAGGREFAMPVRFRELAPTSRREELLTPKEPRRIVALQRLDVPPGAAAQGHLSLPVTVLDTPRRSEP